MVVLFAIISHYLNIIKHGMFTNFACSPTTKGYRENAGLHVTNKEYIWVIK